MMKLVILRNRILPLLAAGLCALLVMWIVLAPAEARLGNVVKLVYVHGALVWLGLLLFSLAGALGLVTLVMRRLSGRTEEARVWVRGTHSAASAALAVWIVYAVSAMAVTELTWGQVIAWNEPRVRATALILGAALVLALLVRLIDQPDFAAAVSLVMGIVPWVVVRQAEVIRHPVDPIGSSGSTAIQVFYSLIVMTIAGLGATLVAWLWITAELRDRSLAKVQGDVHDPLLSRRPNSKEGKHGSYQDHHRREKPLPGSQSQ
jgi:hypothetical protein